MNSLRKKNKNGLYYLLAFLISGITVASLAATYFCMLLI
ncbi:hypothetical protein J2772_004350 [Chryseobacterium jejuense]|nr:hypothetical protein [Chryseobacterium jejuense]